MQLTFLLSQIWFIPNKRNWKKTLQPCSKRSFTSKLPSSLPRNLQHLLPRFRPLLSYGPPSRSYLWGLVPQRHRLRRTTWLVLSAPLSKNVSDKLQVMPTSKHPTVPILEFACNHLCTSPNLQGSINTRHCANSASLKNLETQNSVRSQLHREAFGSYK